MRTSATLGLAELQKRFAAALRADADAAVDPLLLAQLRDDGIAPARRLALYRRNVHGNFLKVLALEFPAIRRLGGLDWFDHIGLEFMREHPSRSGDLHGIGAPFAAFLARRLAGTAHAWFADVAALEWAWQECLVAAEPQGSLDVAALAGVDAARAADLRFEPHPALRLIESRWPVFTIWQANRGDEGDGETAHRDARIDLDSGGEAVLLRRCDRLQAEARRCGQPANVRWLRVLVGGGTLGEAWDAATAVAPDFDVARALANAVSLGLFQGFRGS